MMVITIDKLHVEDFEKLFEFELKNRTYFEEMVPSVITTTLRHLRKGSVKVCC